MLREWWRIHRAVGGLIRGLGEGLEAVKGPIQQKQSWAFLLTQGQEIGTTPEVAGHWRPWRVSQPLLEGVSRTSSLRMSLGAFPAWVDSVVNPPTPASRTQCKGPREHGWLLVPSTGVNTELMALPPL